MGVWDSMVPWMDSKTTCIFVDGSGECPMGFQGPMGEQWVYLYIC